MEISDKFLCKHCKMDIRIRNPSGYCDHLYYPENCEVCAKNNEVKNMETFKATKYSDKLIELTSSTDLEKLYKIIEEEKNFILMWTEGSVDQSKVMIGNNLKAQMLNGDIELSAKHGGK